ncbi:hypothetical protein CLV46_0887 [Diaminobutyricimonas aerilata]|uniref:Uncharacterized protein n=1 Tax=Diaminobutyricimonas aerilata TaxID=1162967 RepID=A0A2M9CHF0_9MICO|nr:hypothetical protein [Diaminobutyricimonas aerilata]PJJ71343.1 hypothetical protein CLV46_0887 [Diaminobutyricimonas aerilata]
MGAVLSSALAHLSAVGWAIQIRAILLPWAAAVSVTLLLDARDANGLLAAYVSVSCALGAIAQLLVVRHQSRSR